MAGVSKEWLVDVDHAMRYRLVDAEDLIGLFRKESDTQTISLVPVPVDRYLLLVTEGEEKLGYFADWRS